MDNETNLLDKGFVMPIYADWSLLNLCGGKRYYCSNCKGKSKENTKYCPHCGAYMWGLNWKPKSSPKHKGVLEQLNEKQGTLRECVAAWEREIEKRGFVN